MVTYIYENTHNHVLPVVNRLYLNKAGFGGKKQTTVDRYDYAYLQSQYLAE